jgi:hypothetical protein
MTDITYIEGKLSELAKAGHIDIGKAVLAVQTNAVRAGALLGAREAVKEHFGKTVERMATILIGLNKHADDEVHAVFKRITSELIAEIAPEDSPALFGSSSFDPRASHRASTEGPKLRSELARIALQASEDARRRIVGHEILQLAVAINAKNAAIATRVSERMCKQVSVSLPLKGDSHGDQFHNYSGVAGSTAG